MILRNLPRSQPSSGPARHTSGRWGKASDRDFVPVPSAGCIRALMRWPVDQAATSSAIVFTLPLRATITPERNQADQAQRDTDQQRAGGQQLIDAIEPWRPCWQSRQPTSQGEVTDMRLGLKHWSVIQQKTRRALLLQRGNGISAFWQFVYFLGRIKATQIHALV